ncbi:5-formyltetrahydrofolate cyclo-ligase [Hyphomicrobium sp. CS1GBMeth3]|uniref:5-formyltetrahydrofolate cyclo-ligase n=1 Tax=Hyphomicrobium sp. CS1GBMeth3 TaxID=1892845 RepID=UPI0009FA5772|nr:5-formyltetrahydrofolate cyclo-ligase [Hyphomicrobium sp. CS1GBMeth3]
MLPGWSNPSSSSVKGAAISTDVAKKEMRRRAKTIRDDAYARHGDHASEAIAGHGIAFAARPPPAIVSGFLAIGNEIDPTPLIERLIGEGYRICLPVMEGKGKPLVFRAWAPGEPLAETTWGIREPLPEAPVLEPDIVLGPLLAFDTAGYRLGYGGGFYDRTLARLRALKPIVSIGIGFDEQRVDAVPHVDYDERLDWILTPSGPLKCPAV